MHPWLATDSNITKMARGSIFSLAMVMTAHVVSTMAQNMSYRADDFYRSDNVTVQLISF